jgi:hypothetical protein
VSILIKGMKMPKGCHSGCPLTDSDAFTCQITGKDIVIYDEDTITSRPSWCPLGDVPTPHGRLVEFIDVAARINEDDGTEEVCVGDVFKAYYEMKNAPTVIEAEEK